MTREVIGYRSKIVKRKVGWMGQEGGLLASERSVSMTATRLLMDMVEEKGRTVVNK